MEFATHEESLKYLKDRKFKVVGAKFYADAAKVIKRIGEINDTREKLTFDIDGAVVKLNDLAQREKMGTTSKFPKWAAAYKYPPEIKETVVEDIVIQVGRTGVLTPKAVVRPVRLAGTTVTNATLHNQDFITGLGLSVGDTVQIRKAGEIIPEILAVTNHQSGAEVYQIPAVCPVCGAKVERDPDGAFLRCTGAACPAQLSRSLAHFVSRDAMDIDGLGKNIVEALIEKGFVKTPADLYYLTVEEMKQLWSKGDTQAKKLLKAIDESKGRDLSRLIFALGIRQVGAKAGKILAGHFGSLDALMNATLEELTNVEDVGEITARNILDWFAQPSAREMIQRLRAAGVNFESQRVVSDARFAGMTFVLTGALTKFTRD